jgi:hypothetical protein
LGIPAWIAVCVDADARQHDRRIADACGCAAYNPSLLTAASRAPANPN